MSTAKIQKIRELAERYRKPAPESKWESAVNEVACAMLRILDAPETTIPEPIAKSAPGYASSDAGDIVLDQARKRMYHMADEHTYRDYTTRERAIIEGAAQILAEHHKMLILMGVNR